MAPAWALPRVLCLWAPCPGCCAMVHWSRSNPVSPTNPPQGRRTLFSERDAAERGDCGVQTPGFIYRGTPGSSSPGVTTANRFWGVLRTPQAQLKDSDLNLMSPGLQPQLSPCSLSTPHHNHHVQSVSRCCSHVKGFLSFPLIY